MHDTFLFLINKSNSDSTLEPSRVLMPMRSEGVDPRDPREVIHALEEGVPRDSGEVIHALPREAIRTLQGGKPRASRELIHALRGR
jgi:hypothetical protein